MATGGRPFPGGLNLFNRHAGSYWMELGPRELICIERKGLANHYRRFQFGDIEMITIAQTQRGTVITFVSALLALVFALVGIAFAFGWIPMESDDAAVIGGLMLGAVLPLIAIAVASVLLGPTCKTMLYTAVHEEELKTLSRLRRANRAVEQLRERIAQIQATQPPSREAGIAGRRVPAPSGPSLQNRASGGWHALFFAAMVLLAGQITLFLLNQTWEIAILNQIAMVSTSISTAGLFFGATALLIHGQARPVSPLLRAAVGASLAILCLFLYFFTTLQFTVAQNEFSISGMFEPAVLFGVGAVFFAIFSVLGLLGLVAVLLHRRNLPPAAEPAP